MWPDNEPAVSGLDWHTGEWNAKAFVIQMLAKALGAGPKDILPATVQFAANSSILRKQAPALAPPSPGPPSAGCYIDNSTGPVTYKYAPGNLFPDAPDHGVQITDTAAGCCKMCLSFKNCSFYTFEYGGTAAQPTCYSKQGGCCFLKTAAAAGGGSPGEPGAVSGSTKPPIVLANATLFAMPYILHATRSKGIMLVNKRHFTVEALLQKGTPTTALVLEGVGPEPGLNPPVERAILEDGRLVLGPYAVAFVRAS